MPLNETGYTTRPNGSHQTQLAMNVIRHTAARLRRLHPFTWCVVLVVSVAMVLIVVPGVEADNDETSPWYASSRKQLYWDTASRYEAHAHQANAPHRTTIWVTDHGWPFPFMLRSLGSFDLIAVGGAKQSRAWSKPQITLGGATTGTSTGAPLEVSWSNRDNWPLESESYHFRLGFLLLDCLAALLVVAIVAALTEGWIRARGGLLRFRTIDFLVVVTGSSVALAWYFHHWRISERENDLVQSMTTETWIRGAENDYAGPKWLARLVGNQELLSFLYHYDSLQWHNSRAVQSLDDWQREFGAVRKLPYLRSVTLPDGVPLTALAELVEQHRLRSVGFEFYKADVAQFISGEVSLVHAHQLELLQNLGIRHLELIGENVLASDIETAAGLPTTTRLTLHDVAASLDDIEAIRKRHPNVEIVTTWGTYRTKEPASAPAQERLARHNEAIRRKAQAEAERLASAADAQPEDEGDMLSPAIRDEVQRTIGTQ